MMTAEQSKYRIDIPTETKFMRLLDGEEISTEATDCELELAAQLAEKEREIAILSEERLKYGQGYNKEYARAKAAEERLKEAQAEIEALQGECVEYENCTKEKLVTFLDLRERLRQREAELEQRDADILRYVDAVKDWRKSMMNATNKPNGALLVALLESARPEWPMTALPSPPKEG